MDKEQKEILANFESAILQQGKDLQVMKQKISAMELLIDKEIEAMLKIFKQAEEKSSLEIGFIKDMESIFAKTHKKQIKKEDLFIALEHMGWATEIVNRFTKKLIEQGHIFEPKKDYLEIL